MSSKTINIRAEKQSEVEQLKEKFKASQIVILTNYRGEPKAPGLTVKEVSALRARIKSVGSEYKVIKNTLAKIAITELHQDVIGDYLVEPTAAIFGYNDPIATAKVIVDFKKEAGKDRTHLPIVKAVYMDGKLLSPEDLGKLATLPGKPVLLSQILAAFKGPLQNFANVLSAPLRDFVNVLEAIKQKKEEQNQ